MRKNPNPPPKQIKAGRQICDRCKRPCYDSAAVEIRGEIKWFCYECYRERKKQEVR